MALSTFDTFKKIATQDSCIVLSDDNLRQLKGVLIEMLQEFDEVCQNLGISYTLGGGSCLGAIRHQGFIPWDDDLDINMTRSDFEKFSAEFDGLLGERYWLHVPGKTPGYDLCFPRLRLKGTIFRTRDDINNDECGVYIDIFIIENAPSSLILRSVHGIISLGLGFCYSCRRFFHHGDEYLSLAGDNIKNANTFKRKIRLGRTLSFASMDWWCKAWDKWNSIVKSQKTKYITIPVGRKHYFGETYPREKYFPVSQGLFCGLSVYLPHDPDFYLRSLYGDDYLTPPEKNNRESHVIYEFDLTNRSIV